MVNNPNYGEEGTGDLMNVQSEDYASVKSVLGVEMTYGLDKLFFYGKLLYTHEFGDDSYDINSMFLNQNLATSTMFRAKGTEFDRDAGIFGVGAGYNINARWRVYIDYAAEFSSDVSHNLNLGAQYKF